jgi:hypothetical protein
MGVKTEVDLMSMWRDRFNGILERMTTTFDNLCNPERLQRRPEYRKRPTEGWLGGFLGALQEERHLLRLADKTGQSTGEEALRLDEWVQTARKCVDSNLAWVQEQLHRELEALVAQYHSANWVEAIRDGLPQEFWFVLSRRDDIEAHLRAPELLHEDLHPDPELVQRVQETDALLREVGPELWQIDAPTGGEESQREWVNPREHWWWWLDQADPGTG